MLVFLANRADIRSKRLHDRVENRLSGTFENVRRRRADPREAGPYRVVGEVDSRQVPGDTECPVTTSRAEIGFRLQTPDPSEYY
jgi:hypothetical protein